MKGNKIDLLMKDLKFWKYHDLLLLHTIMGELF